MLQPIDLLLEGLQLLLIPLDEGQDGRLGSRRDLVPKLGRDRRLRLHAADLQSNSSTGKFSP